ncbi:MobP3 family relaxase [Hominicoprocola fusiformis]|jgi:TPR repeat protein|nr:relaxase MobL [Hominicoprocola fusiformis]
MARLIVKSPYIKCGAGQNAGGYLKYIATRERVEIIPDDRPPTNKQEQLLAKLVADFPDAQELMEYEDYLSHPTKATASALITLTLESNWDRLSSMEGYAKYIALRPRAERLGEHGLFGDDDAVDLAAVADELDRYNGNVWTHIISLHREDAARLGYDHADAWRTLLRTHRNDIAAAMKIPPEDFCWYAAFHDEGNHPHVHIMAWSVEPDQAYLSKDGIRQIKSTLTNQIFRQELLHVYEQKSTSRDELVSEARKAMLELAKAMREMTCIHPEAEQMIWDLSRQLGQVGGRKTYGYLPKPMKKLVDEIVDQMVRLPTVDACYQTWWELQCQVEDYYSEGKKRLRPPLSQQKEFRQIKNAVINEAEHIRMNRISFEDEEMQDDGERISTYDMSYECQDLQSVANDESFPLVERDEAAEQLEQLAESGDAYAQYIIGTAYRDGGLLIPDTVKAQKFLERAAEQDLDVAQYALGKLYLSDDADVHDSAKGIYWLKRSADNGNDYAAYRLGKEYLSGKNVSKDAAAAVGYLWQAANDGNAYAQYLLGKLYLMGEGVLKDTDAAYEWFAAARDNGHGYAEFFMERMEHDEQTPPSVLLSATRLLYHMGNIFRDNAPAPAATGVQIDRKRLAQLRQKRVALGHKPDDHEPEQQQSYSMQMHM